MESFERITMWTPAFDKRDPNPSKNYGINGMKLLFVLKGEKGAVQLLIFTDWQLPHVAKEKTPIGPMAADLGYHSPVPQYEGQPIMDEECQYTPCGTCYYDGSALNAEPVFEIFVTHGEEAMWKELEDYYREVFN